MFKPGNLFAIALAITFSLWVWSEYKTYAIHTEVGYSAEYRARLDDLIAGITPLHTADLGEMR